MNLALFHTVVDARIIIVTPIDQVWAVLTDLPAYSEWNPFTPTIEPVSGAVNTKLIEIGNRMRIRAKLGNKLRKVVMTVNRFELKTHAIAWEFNFKPLYWAERVQLLRKIDDFFTEYVTIDNLLGPLSKLIRYLQGKNIVIDFGDMCSALQQRVENLDI